MKNLELIMLLFVGIVFFATQPNLALASISAPATNLFKTSLDKAKGVFQLNIDCTPIGDDVEVAGACTTETPGVKGKVKIIETQNIDEIGTMDATTKTWDTDITLEVGSSWHDHDTTDATAIFTSTPKEGGGKFDNVLTLFYPGQTPKRRDFFNEAQRTQQKFALGFTAEDGTVYVMESATCSPTFDTKTSEGSDKAGWAVTFKEVAAVPMIYTGVFA